jgi:polyisoprenoid-binding protein YceI
MASAIWSLLLVATLPANGKFDVDPGSSNVRYTVIHKLHRVEGVSHEIEARAAVKEDGQVLAMVRVPVTSFRSGDGNRDEHMIEAVEAGKFPFVVFKGIARLGASRAVPAAPVTMNGEVDLHGVSTPLTVPLSLAVQPDGSVRAHGSFDVSLDAHHVQRPSLLFVRIEDDCHVEFDLVLRSGR